MKKEYLAKSVEDEILKCRNLGLSCSQSTFIGLCKSLGTKFNEDQLLALSSGFSGGIGKTYSEGTCGALNAGVMVLGIYLIGESERVIYLSGEIFNDFKRKNGTVICGKITKEYGFTKCTACCIYIGKKITEMLKRETQLEKIHSFS